MKSQTPNLHSSTNSSALISNFLSSSRSNQNIFHSSGWRMDFTFSRNSRDNRKWPGWRDGKFAISKSHFASSSSNGSIHSFFIILNDFPNHSAENFSFHSFSNFSKSNPRSITIPSIASIEDKNSVLSKFPPRKAKRKSLNVFS